MLLKRITAALLGLIIVGATVYYACSYQFFDKNLTEEQKEAFCKQTSLPDKFLLAASSNSFDAVKNSDESVISNFKSGSYAIELDVAFTKEGVPVLADGREFVTDEAVTLESVFKRFKGKDHLKYIINITEQTDYTKFNELVKKFNLTSSIIISGFSVNDFDFMMNQLYYPVCLNLDIEGDLTDIEYCYTLIDELGNYSPFAIRLSIDELTTEFSNALIENQLVALIIDDVDSEYDMYYALSLNPNGIISKDPHTFYSILVEHDFLDYKR